MELQELQRVVFPKIDIAAVSTDTGLEIIYNGAEAYADVAVAAGGDITLKHGDDDTSEVVDTSVGLPLADPNTGIIDVSDTEGDTIGEILDHLNASANWRVRPVAMRRADSSNNTLITKTQTQCDLAPVALLRDTTVAVQTNTYTIGVRVGAKTLDGPGDGGWTNKLTEISGVATVATPGSGSGYDDGDGALDDLRIVVYSINDVLKTQRRVWKSAPLTSGASFDFGVADWGDQELSSDPGEALLVLIQNSGTGATTITSPQLTVQGFRECSGGMARSERWHLSDN